MQADQTVLSLRPSGGGGIIIFNLHSVFLSSLYKQLSCHGYECFLFLVKKTLDFASHIHGGITHPVWEFIFWLMIQHINVEYQDTQLLAQLVGPNTLVSRRL